MSQPASVRVTVYVAVDPDTAFKVFTEEIDAWYRRGPHTLGRGAIGIRFEPGEGGRFLEVHDADTGEGRVLGRITVWEPGRRLVFSERQGTTVEVDFEALGEETRVTLEHRGLEKVRPELAEHIVRFSWHLMMPWFDEYLKREGSNR